MKTFLVVLIAIMAIGLGTADLVFADVNVDIGIENDNDNENNNTNENTNTMEQGQDQNQGQSQTIQHAREFLGAPGFVGGIAPGTIIEDKIWKSFCPTRSTISADKIHRMKRKFHWGDIFFDWESRTEVTEIEEPKAAVNFITCQMQWPETYDGIGAEIWVNGDTNSTQAEAVGSAMAACIERGFPGIAVLVAERYEGVTTGKSLGVSSAISTVSGDTGVAHAAGGMIGTIKTRNDEYKIVRAMCLISTTTTVPPAITVTPPVIKKTEAPKPTCDINQILKKIEILESKFCPNLNYENFMRNIELANLYIEAYVCSGDKTFLGKCYKVEATGVERNGAIGHFERAEKNLAYLKGREKGDANTQMYEAYKNWATCINVLNGQVTAKSFAKKKHTKFQQGFGQ